MDYPTIPERSKLITSPDMKTFLAIDTISVPFSIAIGNRESVLAEEILFDRMALAGQITLMVDRCCKKSRPGPEQLVGHFDFKKAPVVIPV